MLDDLSEEIRGCLRYAEECARKASEANTPRLRKDFLEMERRWLRLARSYQFQKAQDLWQIPALITQNEPRE